MIYTCLNLPKQDKNNLTECEADGENGDAVYIVYDLATCTESKNHASSTVFFNNFSDPFSHSLVSFEEQLVFHIFLESFAFVNFQILQLGNISLIRNSGRL